jgi:4-amino-4-deoxy-L-arabinose transferase-like glycosyltransferase
MDKSFANPRSVWFVIVMAAVVYLVGNGRTALFDRDEPRYAMASRWMWKSGDWVVPRMGWGENPETPRTAKPPMVYWLQGTAMRALGPTVYAARLPSAVAMVTTLAVLAVVLRRHVDADHAFWTVLVLGTSAMTIASAKMCVTDSVLLLWITLSQLCLYALWRYGASWKAVLGYAVAMGLGGLTKGPVVLGVSATTAVVLWGLTWLDRRRGGAAKPQAGGERVEEAGGLRFDGALVAKCLVTVVVVAAIVGPWLYLVEHRSPGFLERTIGHDVVTRMKEPLEGHKGPPGFYLVTLFGTFFPWSLLLPMALVGAWKHRADPRVRFALAATIGPWLMMECVATKLVHYVLPIFPPLAFLVADAVVRCFRGESDDLIKPVARLGFGIWAAFVFAAAALPMIPLRYFPEAPVWPAVALAVLALGYPVVVLRHVWKRRQQAALVSLGVGFAFFVAVLFGAYFPNATFVRLSPRAADALIADGATGDDVRMIGYTEQSLAFYQGGGIDDLPNKFLEANGPAAWPRHLVITRAIYDALPEEKRAALEVLSRFRGVNYPKGMAPVEVMVVRTRMREGLAAK